MRYSWSGRQSLQHYWLWAGSPAFGRAGFAVLGADPRVRPGKHTWMSLYKDFTVKPAALNATEIRDEWPGGPAKILSG